MNLGLVMQNSLLYGSILSLALSLLIIASLFVNAEMWLSDYPSDIQEQYGEIGQKAKTQRIFVGILFLLVTIALIVISTVQLADTIGGKLRFVEVFLNTFGMLLLFNLVDLLILDWLIFVTIRPTFVILPGTEGMAGYNNYRFHFVAFLKGMILILVVSLIIVGATLLIQAL